MATGKLLRTFEGAHGVNSVAFSPDGTRALSSGFYDARIAMWDVASGVLLVSLFSEAKDSWLDITVDGFFSASPKGEEKLDVVRGLELSTIGQVHQSLFSPDPINHRECPR